MSIALALLACGDDRNESQRDLDEGRRLIRTRADVGRGTWLLGELCCNSKKGTAEAAQACGELPAVVASETDAHTLFTAALLCPRVVPPAVLLEALNRPRQSGLMTDARVYLIEAITRYEPTEEIVGGLVRALGYPPTPLGGVTPVHDYHRVITGVSSYLEYLGDDDLGPLVEALRDPSTFVRGNAARVFQRAATWASLEMPSAEAELERLTADPDPTVASAAGSALDHIERRRRESIAYQVEQLREGQMVELLSRRRRFCGVPEATAALESIRDGAAEPELRSAAEKAIAERTRRCVQNTQ